MHDGDAERLVKHYHNWSPAQKMEHWANLLMEPTFAFVEKGELNLGNLLQEVEMPNRPAYLSGYDRVPKLSNDTRERQARMWSKVVTDTAYAHRVRGIWLGFSARTGPLMRPTDYASKKAEALAGKFQPLPPPAGKPCRARFVFYGNKILGGQTPGQRRQNDFHLPAGCRYGVQTGGTNFSPERLVGCHAKGNRRAGHPFRRPPRTPGL